MLQADSIRSSLLSVPPLENGDRLSSVEFERRYGAMPAGIRAELIEGIVYMAAALRYRSHGQPHSQIHGWLFNYQVETPGVELADAITVRLDQENEPQPDIALLIAPELGGQTTLSADDYIEGAPELVVEVAASTVSIDLGAKKTAYERNGVQEYIVWRVLDGAVDWFYLRDDRYCELLADEDGITRSLKFPGLWLDRSALLRGDLSRVLVVLREGLASPAHGDFCESLQTH
jgi:Uma2 family endonuclease